MTRLAGALFMTVLIAGCSGDQLSESDLATSQQSFDAATSAFQSKQFAAAETEFTNAISHGGLNADALAEAFLLRAEARIELKKLNEARADIDAVAPGAPDLSRLHQLKGLIGIAEGNLAVARQEFTAARKLNPKIALPAALR